MALAIGGGGASGPASALTNGDVTTLRKVVASSQQGATRIVQRKTLETYEDGSTREIFHPALNRIIQGGRNVWIPRIPGQTNGPATSASYTATVYTGAATSLRADGRASDGFDPQVVELRSAGSIIDYDCGVSIPAASLTYNGRWLMDVVLEMPPESVGLQVEIHIKGTAVGGGAGDCRFRFTAGAFLGGVTTLRLWNPGDALSALAFDNGASSTLTRASTLDFTQPITGIRFYVGASSTQPFRVMGAWSATITKAIVCPNWELAAFDSIQENAVKRWIDAGLGCAVRGTSLIDSRGAGNTALMQRLHAYGASIYNGSWNRTVPNDEASARVEMGLSAAWMARNGLVRGATLWSTAGNGVPPAAVVRKIPGQYGIKHVKSGSAKHRLTVCGPTGYDTPLGMRTIGYSGRSNFMSMCDAAIAVGGIYIPFSHGFQPFGSSPPPDTSAAFGGGGTYLEDLDYIIPYLQEKQAAGLIDCVGADEMAAIMEGLA